jgi:hypothetical protein
MWEQASNLSLASLITVLGLIFYGLKARDYEVFYHRLSVDPKDVGLNYATVLTRSTQQIITPLILMVVAIYTYRKSRISEAVAKWKAGRVHAERWLRIRRGRIWIAATVWFLAFVVSTSAFLFYCSTIYFADGSIKLSADTVIEGKSIVTGVRTPSTPLTPSGLSVLNVQVRSAWIEPIQAGSVPPGLKGLSGQHLLYLGQADGTLVLYDPTGGQVVYVPRGFVLLNVEVV